MPNAFLETCQHRLLVAGVDVDDAVRVKADLGQRRREQVLPRDAPKNFAPGARCDPGREQCRSGTVDGGISTAGNFVQRPDRQPTTGKVGVDGIDTERQDRTGAQRRPFKPLNLLAETTNGG